MTDEVKKIHIKIPALPESVTEASLQKWYKKEGDKITAGEHIADVETDKVILEVTAPESGILFIQRQASDAADFAGGEIIGYIEPVDSAKPSDKSSASSSKDEEDKSASLSDDNKAKEMAPASKDNEVRQVSNSDAPSQPTSTDGIMAMPAATKVAADNNVNLSNVKGSGRDARILKEDVLNSLTSSNSGTRIEERVPMSRLRQKIAQRLIQSQQTNAILTTFNEVNMQAIMTLRSKYKDVFEKKNEVKLGFMSFFVKAVVQACKEYPVLNAFIDGTDIIYHGYMDIGIAVSSPRGLVVPILRNAENMSISEIESGIGNYAKKARDGKLELDDISGGTFSITNGGTFGSMMSTPIINPPQAAILGMHAIKERAMVENGLVVVRPMMYLALSYDHRLIDGREAVSALVLIKEALEDPARLLLGV